MPPRTAPFEDLQHVADHGSGGRRYDADPFGQRGQRPLTARREETLSFQLLFQLLEGELQGAESLGFQGLHNHLQFAASVVVVDAAARQRILEELDVAERVRLVIEELAHQHAALYQSGGRVLH